MPRTVYDTDIVVIDTGRRHALKNKRTPVKRKVPVQRTLAQRRQVASNKSTVSKALRHVRHLHQSFLQTQASLTLREIKKPLLFDTDDFGTIRANLLLMARQSMRK